MGAADHVLLFPRRYFGLFTRAFRGGPSEPLSRRAAERTSPQHPLRLQCLCVINGFSGIRLSFFFDIILFLSVCDGPCLLLRLSLVAAGRGLSPFAVHRLLTAAASLAVEQTLGRTDSRAYRLQERLQSTGSVVVVHG